MISWRESWRIWRAASFERLLSIVVLEVVVKSNGELEPVLGSGSGSYSLVDSSSKMSIPNSLSSSEPTSVETSFQISSQVFCHPAHELKTQYPMLPMIRMRMMRPRSFLMPGFTLGDGVGFLGNFMRAVFG